MKLFGISTGWILAASVAASFLSGVYVTRLYYLVDISQEKLVDAKQEAKIAEATLLAHKAAVEKLEKERDNALKNHRDAQIETSRIATALAAGNLRLRIDAVCDPQSGGTEPAAARLTPNAERAYFAHRAAIDDVNKLLDLCGVPQVGKGD